MKLKENQRDYDGGTSINPALEYAAAASSGSYAGAGLLDTDIGDVVTRAQYEWRQYYVTLGWSGRDYLMNKGSKQRLIDLVESSVKNAGSTMRQNLTTGLYQTSKANSTDLDGFNVGALAAGSTACGGLTSTDISTWAPQRDTTTTTLSLAAMNAQYLAATFGTDQPNLGVTTDAVFGYYYNIATPLQRFGDEMTGKLGFKNMTFNGIPIVADKDCTANYLFLLNTSHLWLGVHEDRDMYYEKPQQPRNQDAALGQIFWMGNLICDSRRTQAVLTAVTS